MTISVKVAYSEPGRLANCERGSRECPRSRPAKEAIKPAEFSRNDIEMTILIKVTNHDVGDNLAYKVVRCLEEGASTLIE